MPLTPLPLSVEFYQSESLPFSAQRCINWIPAFAQAPALNDKILLQPPGLKEFVDTSLGAERGGMLMSDVAYFVVGNNLVSVSSAKTFTNLGVIPGNGRVSMANNGRYLVMVISTGQGYVYDNQSNTVTQITSANYRPASTVVFKDEFFVFSSLDGEVFFNSNLNDPFTFDALDFGVASIKPDKIVGLHVNHNELFVAGAETCEIFQNVGGSGFPFLRVPGANIQKGVYAKFSMLEFDNTWVFVGGGLNELAAVWKVSGSSSAQKLSTDAIDKEIQKFTEEELSGAFATTISRHGQFLAIFNFESSRIPSRTFVYNATASASAGRPIWFELQTGVEDGRFRAQSIVKAYGKLLVGDDRSGVIGEFNNDELTYYGDVIFRQSTSQPFSQGGVAVFSGALEATFQSGVGITGEQENPQCRMDYSDDGGRTFAPETTRSLGKVGEFESRSIWERQGRFPVSRVIRFTVTAKVTANLIRLSSTPDVGYQRG
jgi:hypothetical protein